MHDTFQFVGSAFENRYRVDAVIGEGGFGVVYRGFHLRLEHPIAIKCLKIPNHFTPQAREVFLQRFREEGRILIKLGDAPGVPRVFDCGIIERTGGDQVPYLVMEWLDGHSLEEMLEKRRRAKLNGLRPQDAVQLILPAVDALAAAHGSQIAHRDIKPANLFVVNGLRGPTLKVLDFGIAKAMQEGDSLTQAATHTSTNFRAYTPNYAGPEQFTPKRYGASGPWTDVHALGLVLIELLTDKPANTGEDFVECLEAATSDRRPSAQQRGARISDKLEAVIQRAVARSPEHRYPNASALAAALRHVPEATAGGSSTVPSLEPIELGPGTERAPNVSALVGRAPGPAKGGAGPVQATALGPLPLEAAFEQSGPQAPQQGSAPQARMISEAARPDPPLHPSAVTAQGIAVTAPQIQSAPVIPAAPITGGASARARRRGPWLWVAAVVVLLGAVAAAAIFGFAPGKKSSKKKKPDPSARVDADPSKQARTVYALDSAVHRDVFPVAEIAAGDAAGKNHLRFYYEEGGRLTKIEKYNAAGTIVSTTKIVSTADGGIERRISDGRGIEIDVVRVSKDLVETHTDRAGSNLTNGCARVQLKVDAKGDVTDRICQDGGGHVIIDSNGCQVIHSEMGEGHVANSTRCQQEDGRPLADSTTVHLRRFVRNPLLQVTEQSFYGTSDESVADIGGCSRNRYALDAAGNRTAETCIGPTGFPVNFTGTSIATIASAYDDHGCVTNESYRDTGDRPASLGNYSGRVYTRDAYCSELSNSTVGPAGALVLVPGGAAKIERTLDPNGDMIEAHCFDDRSQPMNCSGDTQSPNMGTVLRYTRDDHGRVVSERAYDSGGSPTPAQASYPHETRSTFDAAGKVIEVKYFGIGGQPAVSLGNVARRTYQFDALGAEVSTKAFGIGGEPVVDSTGKHEIRRTYDAKHRLVSIELRDTNGNYPSSSNIRFGPVVWPRGAVRLSIIRETGRTENRFYDESGKEMSVVDCTNPGKPCER